ncbi:MAG TPA: protein kinase [Gammaproteobacteria bacterium]|nr:protein kinase [Gammaproteobacteria bacterium]
MSSPAGKPERIDAFNFAPGRRLGRKYEIIALLGRGYEGEVYKVRELATGIERAAKFFYPHRNAGDRAFNYYANKLNKLRRCPILISYLTHDEVTYRGRRIRFIVSEYVEGELLSTFLRHQPGGRLTPFEGMHLLHTLAAGLETIHEMREYHGDLHTDNIIIKRRGIRFQVKLIDMYRWRVSTGENIREDVVDIIRIFYDTLGGAKYYAKQPPEVKRICRGLKRTLIKKQFRTAGQLRRYLETMEWESR